MTFITHNKNTILAAFIALSLVAHLFYMHRLVSQLTVTAAVQEQVAAHGVVLNQIVTLINQAAQQAQQAQRMPGMPY